MKTIMDAVNELRGDLGNLKRGLNPHHKHVINMPKIGGLVGTATASPSEISDLVEYVCSIPDFTSLVLDLKNWQPAKKPFSKFERDIEIELFGHSWIVGIIYDSFDTLHEFDIQSLLLNCSSFEHQNHEDLTVMLDSCSSLYQQFECAVIAKLEEERQNV